MPTKLFFIAPTVVVAAAAALSSCARPPGDRNQRSDAGVTETPKLTGAELPTAERRTFEQKRDAYVKQRLAELPHIDRRIRALEFDESVERGRLQQDSKDLVPRIHDARSKYEADLRRAETAGPEEFPALKKEIDDLDFELETYLRKPSP